MEVRILLMRLHGSKPRQIWAELHSIFQEDGLGLIPEHLKNNTNEKNTGSFIDAVFSFYFT